MAEGARPLWEVFEEWRGIYKEKFGKRFIIPVYAPVSREKAIEIMKRCIETNTPYEYPEIPEGCIA